GALGRRLIENGARVVTSLEGRSNSSTTRAREAGMESVADPDLMEAEIFLSVVPPGEALALAERFAPRLQEATKRPVYVDCNAVNPATARRIAEVVNRAGGDFVDAGIIGLPPKPGSPGPAIYC